MSGTDGGASAGVVVARASRNRLLGVSFNGGEIVGRVQVVTGKVAVGLDVTATLLGCLRPGTLGGGGVTFRCPLPGSMLGAGDHALQVELRFADQSRRRNAVRWTVVPNTEP